MGSTMWMSERLSEFITLLLIINPFGVLPVFLAITGDCEPGMQRRIALRAVIVALVTLVFFVAAGHFILAQMKIPIRAFQISGGIVLFLFALDMLRGDRTETTDNAGGALARAIYPLGIPKIAGPGAMLTVILLTDDDRYNLTGQLMTVGMLALALVLTLLILLAAVPLSRLIGQPGASVIGRIMGVLLAAFAVGMVLSAVADWLKLPPL
ncbi:MAG: MarC family protein [Pseudorhodoplanes sp.]